MVKGKIWCFPSLAGKSKVGVSTILITTLVLSAQISDFMVSRVCWRGAGIEWGHYCLLVFEIRC